MHSGIKIGIVLLVLIIAAIAGMAVTGFCPPAGPWPQPPWCSGPGQAPGLSSLPFVQQSAYGESPAVSAGTKMAVPIEVSVPATPDTVTLTLNG